MSLEKAQHSLFNFKFRMETKKQCTIRVTLVDDNAIFRLIFSNMLSGFSDCLLEILTFDNALEFLENFPWDTKGDSKTDILFIDINMPFMSGWELMDKLEVEAVDFLQAASVYIISSSSSKSDRDQTSNYPTINGYVLKPVPKIALFEIIKKHIATNRL